MVISYSLELIFNYTFKVNMENYRLDNKVNSFTDSLIFSGFKNLTPKAFKLLLVYIFQGFMRKNSKYYSTNEETISLCGMSNGMFYSAKSELIDKNYIKSEMIHIEKLINRQRITILFDFENIHEINTFIAMMNEVGDEKQVKRALRQSF